MPVFKYLTAFRKVPRRSVKVTTLVPGFNSAAITLNDAYTLKCILADYAL